MRSVQDRFRHFAMSGKVRAMKPDMQTAGDPVHTSPKKLQLQQSAGQTADTAKAPASLQLVRNNSGGEPQKENATATPVTAGDATGRNDRRTGSARRELPVREFVDRAAQAIGNNPGLLRRDKTGKAAFQHSVEAFQTVVVQHIPSGRWITGKARVRVTLYPDLPDGS